MRRNIDDFIYIHYVAPPSSARISAIYLLAPPLYQNLIGNLGPVCTVQCLATKQNGEFTRGWVKTLVPFNLFVDQSSRNFRTM